MAMAQPLKSPLLSVAEVATAIGRSPDTVLLAIRNKRLKAVRVGERKYSILQSDFEEWFRDGARTSPMEGTEADVVEN